MNLVSLTGQAATPYKIFSAMPDFNIYLAFNSRWKASPIRAPDSGER
jgi:hypothetical protein